MDWLDGAVSALEIERYGQGRASSSGVRRHHACSDRIRVDVRQ